MYFDLLRLSAALEVFVFHLAGLPNTGASKALWNSFGHEAVVVFFVLSGFVIPFSTTPPRTTGVDPRPPAGVRAYAVARLTRVYSVVLPCLVLTYVFDRTGQAIDPQLYSGMPPPGSDFLRLLMGATMLNEAWVSIQIMSNTPFWSISYEFWYYVIFATLFYCRGRTRIALTAGVMLIASPNIMLLFPIWAVGWLAFRETATRRWRKSMIWLAFVQPAVVFAVYYNLDLQRAGGQWLERGLGHDFWWTQMAWSRYLLTDTMLACSIALNLTAAKQLGPELNAVIGFFRSPIRWGVARSFTLYLLHQPAILVVTAVLAAYFPNERSAVLIATIALVIIAVVAQVTEMQRGRLKPLVRWLVDLVSDRLKALRGVKQYRAQS
ncbi:acyltransferase [Sphingomonas sp.]|uniref:acyltransferase family protein n=1 Tax=Sphingomonas sp. TaxID=28214 RepID=UPI0025E8585D|nr:acyltransferase [Sphingomonas sp.]